MTAKGIEDTALYIYNRLVSLNEVGGEPDRFGVVARRAARAGWRERAGAWPHGLSATSTHDTKRSEDVRARINVLSELPGRVEAGDGALGAREPPRRARSIDGQSYPSRNEEYLLLPDAGRHRGRSSRWTPAQERVLPRAHRRLHAEGDARGQGLHQLAEPERAARAGDDALRRGGARAGQHGVPARTSSSSSAGVAQLGIYNSLAQLAVKIGAPGRAGLLPGHRALGLQPGRSGQSAAGRLRHGAGRCSRRSTTACAHDRRGARRDAHGRTRATIG